MIENLTTNMIIGIVFSFSFNLVVQMVYRYYAAGTFDSVVSERFIKLAPYFRYLTLVYDAVIITTMCWYCKTFVNIPLEVMIMGGAFLCLVATIREIAKKKFSFKQHLKDSIFLLICLYGSYYIFFLVS